MGLLRIAVSQSWQAVMSNRRLIELGRANISKDFCVEDTQLGKDKGEQVSRERP